MRMRIQNLPIENVSETFYRQWWIHEITNAEMRCVRRQVDMEIAGIEMDMLVLVYYTKKMHLGNGR